MPFATTKPNEAPQHHQDTVWLLPTQGKGKFASQFLTKARLLSESHIATSLALTGASNGGIKPHAKSNK